MFYTVPESARESTGTVSGVALESKKNGNDSSRPTKPITSSERSVETGKLTIIAKQGADRKPSGNSGVSFTKGARPGDDQPSTSKKGAANNTPSSLKGLQKKMIKNAGSGVGQHLSTSKEAGHKTFSSLKDHRKDVVKRARSGDD